MFSNLWRRLTGGGGPVVEHEAPATTAEEAEVVSAAPAAAPGPGGGVVPDPARNVSTEETLHRSLEWRCRVLLDGATRDALASDAPALVEILRHANHSVIRQPPSAAMQALKIARNPNTPLPAIVDLFESDPMLAQALFRMANSVYYRRDGDPFTSLNAAVQRIGLNSVQGILSASLVRNMLCRPGGAYDALVQDVWTHMQRTAPVARSFAPAFGVDPEAAYSLALLHDVGKLIIFDHVSSLRHDRKRDLKFPDVFFRQMLWHLHEPLGGLALLRWGMGGEAAHAVGEHHRRPVPEQPDTMTECLFVAERVELAQTRHAELDWDAIWRDGGITRDVAGVQDRLPNAGD